MAQPALINTARGAYRLTVAEQSAPANGSWILTLSAEHQGGLEKFAFRCVIADALLKQAPGLDSTALCARLAVWLEKQFEQVREAALKSIRSERRLVEFEFNETTPGPF